MDDAVNAGIDLIAARQKEYRANRFVPCRPWLFMITDGAPTDRWARSATRFREGETRKSFSFFTIGVDDDHLATMSQISVSEPVNLRGLAFGDMVRWLTNSLPAASRLSNDQQVTLVNPAGPAGWTSIS